MFWYVHTFTACGACAQLLPNQMAAFLIAQGDHDYFSMSREWTDGGWGWHPLYASTRCGKAVADAVAVAKQVYMREFERCTVRLDLDCGVATRDGCGSITPKWNHAQAIGLI